MSEVINKISVMISLLHFGFVRQNAEITKIQVAVTCKQVARSGSFHNTSNIY